MDEVKYKFHRKFLEYQLIETFENIIKSTDMGIKNADKNSIIETLTKNHDKKYKINLEISFNPGGIIWFDEHIMIPYVIVHPGSFIEEICEK